MRVVFLGTSSGAPTIDRNVTGIAIADDYSRHWFLVDCGEGTQHQILRTSLSVMNLQVIFITHVHGDHCYGLPGLLASAGMLGRTDPLTIVAPEGVEEFLKTTIRCSDLHLEFELTFMRTEAIDSAVVFSRYSISVIELSHRVRSFAYAFTEHFPKQSLDIEKLTATGIPRGPLWGKIQQGEQVEYASMRYDPEEYLLPAPAPITLVVAGDNDSPELLSSACSDAHLLIHECTYANHLATRAGEVGHTYARQIAEFAQNIGLPHLILTHFSARYQRSPHAPVNVQQIYNEAAEVYQGELYLAEDFAEYELAKSGQLQMVHAPSSVHS